MAQDIEVRESEDLTLPHTGEVISLSDANACALALQELRALEARAREAKGILTAAIVLESKRQGSKTLYLDGVKVEVRGGSETVWDVQMLEEGLRYAGLPEDRLREVIKEEVTYSVNAREAKRVAGANEDYASVVRLSQTQVEKNPYVVVSRHLEGTK